jgi:hypothetical protein
MIDACETDRRVLRDLATSAPTVDVAESREGEATLTLEDTPDGRPGDELLEALRAETAYRQPSIEAVETTPKRVVSGDPSAKPAFPAGHATEELESYDPDERESKQTPIRRAVQTQKDQTSGSGSPRDVATAAHLSPRIVPAIVTPMRRTVRPRATEATPPPAPKQADEPRQPGTSPAYQMKITTPVLGSYRAVHPSPRAGSALGSENDSAGDSALSVTKRLSRRIAIDSKDNI